MVTIQERLRKYIRNKDFTLLEFGTQVRIWADVVGELEDKEIEEKLNELNRLTHKKIQEFLLKEVED